MSERESTQQIVTTLGEMAEHSAVQSSDTELAEEITRMSLAGERCRRSSKRLRSELIEAAGATNRCVRELAGTTGSDAPPAWPARRVL